MTAQQIDLTKTFILALYAAHRASPNAASAKMLNATSKTFFEATGLVYSCGAWIKGN